jgi:hypothetical protein
MALTIYAEGVFALSVCTDLSPHEATAEVNQMSPAGTAKGWMISEEPFATGQPNPCLCERDPDRKHYLFVC